LNTLTDGLSSTSPETGSTCKSIALAIGS
jgi:hypothetical protein